MLSFNCRSLTFKPALDKDRRISIGIKVHCYLLSTIPPIFKNSQNIKQTIYSYINNNSLPMVA